MGERLIPKEGLSFYPGSDVLPSPTPHFMFCWTELKFESTSRMSSIAMDGIDLLNYTKHSSSPGSRNRADFHWYGGSSSSTLKSGVCEQKIRKGGFWVSN